MAKTIYATAAELKTYAAERGVSLLSAQGVEYTDDEVNVFLTKAQDYIDLVFTYVGEPVGDYSQFPRTGLGSYDETTVPPAVRISTMYVAAHLIDGLPILEGQKAQAEIKKEVVASNRIETEYATNYKDPVVQSFVVLDAPLYMLRRAGLLSGVSTGGMNMFGLRG